MTAKPFAAAAGIALALLVGAPAFAIQPDEILPDKRLEARARSIGKELRCLVCQNESIDDSEADLARDLRLIVRQRLLAGDTDAQVKAYVVARYGNYVLLKPPFNAETVLLWFAPAILAAAAGGLVVVAYRRRTTGGAPAPALTAEDEIRVAELLARTGQREDA
ncbi:MAG: cytochrome c-type biogenesis protein [Pseudomonadota bacterium]|jgi:cytochrome c-type biogenesis protein CcmH